MKSPTGGSWKKYQHRPEMALEYSGNLLLEFKKWFDSTDVSW